MRVDTEAIYEYQPSFILGFHGCDRGVGEDIIAGRSVDLRPSESEYDWLGHGIYFWEGNLMRAFRWAQQRQTERRISEPFVLGAVIDLRHCLDLFDAAAMASVREAHEGLRAAFETSGERIPRNVGNTPDKAGRRLDCAVMNALHAFRKRQNFMAYDSVRSPFLEGDPLYDGAGFRCDSHIQICVRQPDCIKGYFRPFTRMHPSKGNMA